MHSRRIGAVVLAATLSAATLQPAYAAPDGSNVVLNEVYGGGGNSGATLTHDFIELFNPTDNDIDLTGWSVEYFSGSGNSGGTAQLSGTIPAGGYFLIQAAQGNGGDTALPTPDATSTLAMSGTRGSVQLYDASSNPVDLVGFGNAELHETNPAPAPSNTTSVTRTDGVDTDDNSADFSTGTPSPVNSQGDSQGESGDDDNDNNDAPSEPIEGITEIVDIQGTGDTSPLEGRTVRTTGVVTGVWEEGGKNGFTIQQPGVTAAAGEASPGLFVYLGNRDNYPDIDDTVEVTGEVSEYFGSTQVTASAVDQAEQDAEVEPVDIVKLPQGDEARESFEHVLVLPGTHTVTNNYALNQYGEVGLADGTEALRQPSDVHSPSTDPNSDLQKLQAENDARLVTLDDGRTRDYLKTDQETPLPYLAQDDAQTIKPLRTTDQVEFQHPVIVDYSHEQWRFQPTEPVTGNTAGEDLPIAWENSRAAEEGAMDNVDGDYSIAAFNVLNYFTSLGEEFGGSAYTDKDGNPVTVNRGTTRGAYTAAALRDQETKIVAAINGLDADVVGLSEIEDGFAVTGDFEKRDQALAHLTEALNAAGGNWDYVRSPGEDVVPDSPDVIRTAFIYQKDRVEPVGESRIFEDRRFTGTAREPLAQEFKAADSDDTFVAVANHFKSKGSVAKGDADTGDGQGNNANVRNAQAQAVLDHLGKQDDWKDKPTFVLGDLNSYTHEDAINVFRTNGYTVPAETFEADPSYQFSGLLGSLDHVLANDIASNLLDDAEVWNINADEAISFEYSRRNYNTVDFHDDSPFRSSDHDPVKVGFSFDQNPEDPEEPEEPGDNGNEPGDDDKPGAPGNGSSGSSGSNLGSSTGGVLAAIAGVLFAVPALGFLVAGLPRVIPAPVLDALPKPVRDFINWLR